MPRRADAPPLLWSRCAGICAESLRADEVVYTVSGTFSTNGGGDVNLPQFNPALGQIDFGYVSMLTLGPVTGTATFEIPASGGPNAFQALLLVDGSDGTIGASPAMTEVVATGGSSGTVTVTEPWSLDLPLGAPFADIPFSGPPFVGMGTASVFFPINIYCAEPLFPVSCGPGVTEYLTNFTVTPSIAFTAQVVYPYIPAVVPEPRLILPTALLLLGTITGRFRRSIHAPRH
jgi:hypothetical protein